MLAWSTTQWAIVILAFVAGFLIGTLFCTGRKWKTRYKEESVLRAEETRRREALEKERTHWEAQNIASRAKDPPPPR